MMVKIHGNGLVYITLKTVSQIGFKTYQFFGGDIDNNKDIGDQEGCYMET